MAREGSGAPFQISYGDAFHSLNEKIETKAIAGVGTKINWIVSPAHEQLPSRIEGTQATLGEVLEFEAEGELFDESTPKKLTSAKC